MTPTRGFLATLLISAPFWGSAALAQASCAAALPVFTQAMRDGTAEALNAYLAAHAPCFEVPARARLATLAPAATPAPEAEVAGAGQAAGGGAGGDAAPDPAPEPAPDPAPAEAVATAPAVAAPAAPPVQAAKPTAPAAPQAAGGSCATLANARSERWDQPVQIQVRNATVQTLSVSWIDYEGRRQFSQRLAPGGIYGSNTFLTHPFEFTREDGRCLAIILPQAGVRDYSVSE